MHNIKYSLVLFLSFTCCVLVAAFAQISRDKNLRASGDLSHNPTKREAVNRFAASTGFITIANTQAFEKPPIWPKRTLQRRGKISTGLAVIGQPVDLQHTGLTNHPGGKICIGVEADDIQSNVLCTKLLDELETGVKFGFDYKICQFDPDCFHATAAAYLATGLTFSQNIFSIAALARLPAWNMTDNLQENFISLDRNNVSYLESSKSEDEINGENFAPRIFPEILLNGEEPYKVEPFQLESYAMEEAQRTDENFQLLKTTPSGETKLTADYLLRELGKLKKIRAGADFLKLLKKACQSINDLNFTSHTIPGQLDIGLGKKLHKKLQRSYNYNNFIDDIKTSAREIGFIKSLNPGICQSVIEPKLKKIIFGYNFKFIKDYISISNFNEFSEKIHKLKHEITPLTQLMSELASREYEINQILPVLQFRELPTQAFPMISVYDIYEDIFSLSPRSSFINRNILVNNGAAPGAPVFPISVFSRIDDERLCEYLDRTSPCVLTDLGNQRRALDYVDLISAEQKTKGSRRESIGAVLIVATGKLVTGTCDQTETAKAIERLRARGIFTFVPVGNDGAGNAVRFPACASAAIAVGAAGRDGKPLSISNGRNSKMVDLWMDGDAVAIPMHAPGSKEFPGCMKTNDFSETITLLQHALVLVGNDPGPINGQLGDATRAALLRYQKKNIKTLSKSNGHRIGRFDRSTLQILLKEANKIVGFLSVKQQEKWDNLTERTGTEFYRNLNISGIDTIEDYQEFDCRYYPKVNYHPYFAGGTLVSASVAAGTFLRLLSEHSNKNPREVMEQMTSIVSRAGLSTLVSDLHFDRLKQSLGRTD